MRHGIIKLFLVIIWFRPILKDLKEVFGKRVLYKETSDRVMYTSSGGNIPIYHMIELRINILCVLLTVRGMFQELLSLFECREGRTDTPGRRLWRRFPEQVQEILEPHLNTRFDNDFAWVVVCFADFVIHIQLLSVHKLFESSEGIRVLRRW